MKHHLHTEIYIDAPPAAVWAVLTDFEAYPEWNPFLQRLEGALEEGAALRVTLGLGGSPMRIGPRVVEVRPGHSFAWLGHLWRPGLFDGRHGFILEPQGDGTRFIHEEHFEGWLVRPILLAAGKDTRLGFEAMNEALKARCERNPP